MGDGEAARPAAELLQDRDPGLERRPEVRGPLRDVPLVQVVGAHPEGEEPLEQVPQDPRGGVHSPEEHGLVLHRDAVIHERLAGRPRLRRALLRVVEVRDEEEGRVAAEHRGERAVDPHRVHDRRPRRDPEDLDVGDRAEGGEDLLESLVREDERVPARDDDVADLRVGPHVGDRLGDLVPPEPRLLPQGDPPARAVPAVDRAAVHREEERPVPVPVDERAHGAAGVLAEGIPEVPRGVLHLRRGRDALHPDGAGRVLRVHERGVVGRHRHAGGLLRERQPLPLLVREPRDPLEVRGRPERVPVLPAPVAPLRRLRRPSSRFGPIHPAGAEARTEPPRRQHPPAAPPRRVGFGVSDARAGVKCEP